MMSYPLNKYKRFFIFLMLYFSIVILTLTVWGVARQSWGVLNGFITIGD